MATDAPLGNASLLRSNGKDAPSPSMMFRDMGTLELHSSGGPIDKDSIGWLKPADRNTPIEEMRQRYEADGYIWVKQLIPKEDVWRMRETYFSYLPGLTKEGTAYREGIYCGEDWRLVSDVEN